MIRPRPIQIYHFVLSKPDRGPGKEAEEMGLYQRNFNGVWYFDVYDEHGIRRRRSTGTNDYKRAQKVEAKVGTEITFLIVPNPKSSPHRRPYTRSMPSEGGSSMSQERDGNSLKRTLFQM